VVLLAIVAAVVLSPALNPGQAKADQWYSSVRSACRHSISTMLCYHVRTRALAHIPKLQRSEPLYRSAELKAARIERCNQHRHDPCGDDWVQPFYTAGYLPSRGAWAVGENIAWGWANAWQAFNALMHSPSHRANILDPRFRDVGVQPVRRSAWGSLWVIHYGRRA
jgi:uncharacterized protein YkwD